MNKQAEVIIIGAGVVGLSCAIAMAERGYGVAVIDAQPMTVDLTSIDRRVYAINQGSERLLTRLGVWALMDKQRLSPYQGMLVWDAANDASITFNARTIAASKLGTIIEESIIKQALLDRVAQISAISIFPGQAVSDVKVEGDAVHLHSQDMRWQGQLLIIADGANSPSRERLNVPLTSWSYHQHALVATVKTTLPHQQTAYQVFNADGPLAFLPLADPYTCSIVWSTTPTRAEQLQEESPAIFNTLLTQAFANKLGPVTLQSERVQFPLRMRHVKQYTGKNWLLMGDAAHTIHPLAGLGLNVGLADVAAWMDCLAQTPDLTSARALGRYQRQRKQAVWESVMLMEGLKTLFLNPLPPVAWLRGLGIRCCDNLTPLKRLFINHAAGV